MNLFAIYQKPVSSVEKVTVRFIKVNLFVYGGINNFRLRVTFSFFSHPSAITFWNSRKLVVCQRALRSARYQ